MKYKPVFLIRSILEIIKAILWIILLVSKILNVL